MAVETRERTVLERQPYMLAYGVGISCFSPLATCYQLCKMYKHTIPPSQMVKLSARIFPHQIFLKWSQMNLSTPVKDVLNPWAAFSVVGILQGGVYGQANIYFSDALKIGKKLTYKGMFRGVGFAAVRDTLSGGLPFQCSGWVRENILDPIAPSKDNPDGMVSFIKKWTAVLSTSMFACVISQGPHNLQILMQSNQTLTYATALQEAWKHHGIKILYRGADARVSLLLVVNILNELLLRPAWARVPVEGDI